MIVNRKAFEKENRPQTGSQAKLQTLARGRMSLPKTAALLALACTQFFFPRELLSLPGQQLSSALNASPSPSVLDTAWKKHNVRGSPTPVRPFSVNLAASGRGADDEKIQAGQSGTGKERVQNHRLLEDEEILQRLQEREEDFEEALDLVLPVSPEEIRRAREKKEALERAASPDPAKMHVETRTIPVTPNTVPQVVRLTQGYSSTLVFHDVTGRPWPVLNVVLGNPQAFSLVQANMPEAKASTSEHSGASAKEESAPRTVQGEENSQSHILNIVPLTERASANLALTLEDCPYPLILHLITDSPFQGRRTSDALVIFRLNKRGPRAEQGEKTWEETVSPVTDETLAFIHALPVPEATALRTEPVLQETQLWRLRGKLYLRTRYDLVWPAWQAVAHGDDIRVYVLPKTTSLVVAVEGKSHTLRIHTKEDRP